jgi:hypothetical protein
MAGERSQAANSIPNHIIADILGKASENTNDIGYDFKCNGSTTIRVCKGGANHDVAFVYARNQHGNDTDDGQLWRLEQEDVFYCPDFTAIRYVLKAHGTRIFILKSDDLLNGDDDADWDAANDNAEELARIVTAADPFYEPEEPPSLASDINTHTVAVTFFPNRSAQSQRCIDLTLPQLAEQIRLETAPDKLKLPWLKLARFGNTRSPKGCLRTNANVQEITGIEVEHDKGEIAFDTALATLRAAKLRAIAKPMRR